MLGCAHEPSLPLDVWCMICSHLTSFDLISAAGVCRDLAAVANVAQIWDDRLEHAAAAALEAVVEPRLTDPRMRVQTVEPALVAEVVELAQHMAGVGGDGGINSYFASMPRIAEAAVSTLRPSAPALCLVAFAQRVYDTTDFVQRHPGGPELMQNYHGKDATRVFDAFPHSPHAHDLMRDEMLRFDGIAHVGRFGAPFRARHALAPSWSVGRELRDLAGEAGSVCRALTRPLVRQVRMGFRQCVSVVSIASEGGRGGAKRLVPPEATAATLVKALLAASALGHLWIFLEAVE